MNYNILADCRGIYEQDIFETVCEQRGITDVDHFLNPTEDDMLPLDSMINIDKAAKQVVFSRKNYHSIGVLADVDTDGICAGTIMYRYLHDIAARDIQIFINEGKTHGLTEETVDRYNDLDLLIIVDSLDSNIEFYKKLTESNVKIIVLDHHAINSDVPYDKYVTLVSSQRDYANPALSGSGVVWKFCKYLDQYFNRNYADQYVDLAATGIVADMMDMTVMENRYIVNQGLHNKCNPAIKKIIGSFEFNSTAVAFSVAPLINAANRMGHNNEALQAFLADDNKEVLKYVKILKKCKEEQNEEVDRLMPVVLEQCERQVQNKMIVTYIDTPYGIAGLIANKLLEKYQRPILVLKEDDEDDGFYAGSMRATGLKDFRTFCNDSELASCAGHELAAGIRISKFFMDAFIEYVDKELPELDMNVTQDVDIQISITDVTRRLVDMIHQLDFISGTRFKPVKVYIDDIDEYEIGQMSNYKHLVIKPSNYVQIIKWNFTGDFDEMEDHSMMNDELAVVGVLDKGFFGRQFVLKVICDEIREVE